MSSYVPAPVRQMAKAAWKTTRIVPDTVPTADGGWEVSVSTDRVRAVAVYGQKTPGGRLEWLDGYVLVDGTRHPAVKYLDDLPGVLADPDAYVAAAGAIATTDEWSEVPASSAPTLIRQMHRSATEAAAMKESHPAVRVVRSRGGTGTWALHVFSELAEIRLPFTVTKGHAAPDPEHVMVVKDGKDISAEVSGDLEAVIRLMTGRPSLPGPGPTVVPAARPAARNMSVEVRRQTVVRV